MNRPVRPRRLATGDIQWIGLEPLEGRVLLSTYTVQAIAPFTASLGSPTAGLSIDAAGNLYGVSRGGAAGQGAVYELAATGARLITSLASFNKSNGSDPRGRLLVDAAGNLFGTTRTGGSDNQGTVFKVNASNHKLSTVASFKDKVYVSDGYTQYVSDGYWDYVNSGYWETDESGYWETEESGYWDWIDDGYWDTDCNGDWQYYDDGYWDYVDTSSSYWVDTSSSYWVDTSYSCWVDTSYSYWVDTSYWAKTGMGIHPMSGLIQDAQGNLYGTTQDGGAADDGAVYSLSPSAGKINTLASFSSNGAGTTAGAVMDGSGNLYGISDYDGSGGFDSQVYEVIKGSGRVTTLALLDGAAGQSAGLTIDAAGNLFGVTAHGGDNGLGSIFELARGSRTVVTLASFSGLDGRNPAGELTLDAAGDLFGVTDAGGATGDGVAFELAAGSAAPVVLANLDSHTTGSHPVGPLVTFGKGNLFGVTTLGGATGYGEIFELSPVPGPPAMLAFVQQPGSSLLGGFASTVSVEIEDAIGLRVADNSEVTLSIATGPAGATLTGTVTATAVNGVATFNNLLLSATGQYTLRATDATLASATSGTFTVNSMDLSAKLGGTWTLPASAVAGSALKGSVSAVVSNVGTVALPAGEQITIQFLAHDTTNPANPDILLGTLAGQSVGGLAANASKTFTATINRSAGLPSDSYQILANVSPVQPLTEPTTANNVGATTAAGAARTVTASPHFVDLIGTFGATWGLPTSTIAGKPLSGSVSALVSNMGNTALPKGQQVNIQFLARDITNPANPDIVLATLVNQTVSALAAGATKTFTGSVSRPAGLPADNYQILANVIPVQSLVESNAANNVVAATAAGVAKGVASAPAFVDLAGKVGTTWTLRPTVIAGKPLAGRVSVVVSNLGNVALPKGQQVTIQFLARDLTNPANPDIVLATLANQSLSALAAKASKTFTATITRPAGLPADSYQILASIVPVAALAESSLANNLVTLAGLQAA